MKICKNNKGITLIALVVSIIVLLILAGMSISMLTGQNGILNRASEAREQTETSQKEENKKMQGYEDLINIYETGGLPKGEGTKPYLPDSTFSYKEGNLNTGLVIIDNNGNEYVWVEVPKTDAVYQTAGINIENFNNSEYISIEADLKNYTSDYSNINYNDANPSFTTQYKKMLKSVYDNGGFWIGRYEAGLEGNIPRTGHSEITYKAVIKQNMLPYNYITRDEAQELAEGMNYENCTSSLIFGVQWDLALKNVETKNAMLKDNLILDSKTIGNYRNSLYNISIVNAKYSIDNGNSFSNCPYKKENEVGALLTTGANLNFKLMNIYDMGGNVWEWTLEMHSDGYPCAFRGGSYDNSGDSYCIKSREVRGTSDLSNNIGFRIGLWN